MTDRELLELAANVYWGSEIDDVCSIRWLEVDQCIGYTHADNQDHNGQDVELAWNPLLDDGDALRLAVDLHMLVDIRYRSPGAIRYNRVTYWVDPLLGQVIEFGDMETCLRAATRRAIVRAAAELAKQEVKG